MGLIRRSVEIPIFLKLREGTLHRARRIVEESVPSLAIPLLVTDAQSHALAVEALASQWPGCVPHCIGDNTFAECDRLAEIFRNAGHGFVLGFGGGRALDVGKCVARQTSGIFVSMPTHPSHDGIASPVAVLKDARGVSQSVAGVMPTGVLVDLGLLARASERTVAAGTGDLISNLSAIADWQLAEEDTGERVDDYALLLADQSALLVLRYLEGGGRISEPGYRKRLVEGLILSGIAMNIAGSSRPASGAEHEFSHAIDALFPGKATLHGFQVAFGMLIAEKLREKDIAPLKRVFAGVGLPTTVAALGLTLDEAAEALAHAPKTRPDRYTILEKRGLTREECRAMVASV